MSRFLEPFSLSPAGTTGTASASTALPLGDYIYADEQIISTVQIGYGGSAPTGTIVTLLQSGISNNYPILSVTGATATAYKFHAGNIGMVELAGAIVVNVVSSNPATSSITLRFGII